MKLFSRKALVAGAAAVALSFAGTSAAAAEEDIAMTTPTPVANDEDLNTQDNEGGDDNTPDEGGDDNEGGDDSQDNTGNGGSSSNNGDDENDKDKNKGSSDMKPEDISAWISVFTAVIGALGALFAFASKHLGFKL